MSPTSYSYSSNSNSNSNNKAVPFFVLHLDDDRVKALFRVPSDISETLIQHPILCRGSSFDIKIDVVSSQCRDNDNDDNDDTTTTMIQTNNNNNNNNNDNDNNAGDTCFLSTEYSSPDPEGTAQAIAERIAIRIESPSTASFSNLFG
jgi:hypothetical protein